MMMRLRDRRVVRRKDVPCASPQRCVAVDCCYVLLPPLALPPLTGVIPLPGIGRGIPQAPRISSPLRLPIFPSFAVITMVIIPPRKEKGETG